VLALVFFRDGLVSRDDWSGCSGTTTQPLREMEEKLLSEVEILVGVESFFTLDM
jgi:hypothetical protein